MKKFFKTSLYNSLLTSDFFLLNSPNLNKNNSFINHNISAKTVMQSLNFYDLIKSIKQLIRLLHFLKQNKLHCIYIKVDNKYHYYLLKQFLISYPCPHLNIKIQDTLSFKPQRAKTLSFLILLENNQSLLDKNLFKRLYNNNIFLINKINSKVEYNNGGTYKIYNDLLDFKKVIFLITLINTIFSTTTNNK